MRVVTIVALVVFVVAVVPWASGYDQGKQKQKREASVGMKIKLDMAQQLLAGLATADFKTLARSGKAMQGLNVIEALGSGKTPEYRAQLREFRFATQQLVRAAEAKNVDAATIAYTQMTIGCVNCHKLIRK